MPATKPHSQWDVVWVAEQAEAKRPVRFPPRLGRRRPVIERVKKWAAANPSLSWWVFVIVILIWTALMIMAGSMLERKVGEWVRLVCGMLGIVVPYAAYIILAYGRMDLQCVYAAHQRTRAMRGSKNEAVASEIADRRWYWTSRIKNMGSSQTVYRLMMRSMASRLFMCLLFAYFTLAKISSGERGGRPRGLNSWNSLPINFAMLAILLSFFALNAWLWRRMKRRLRRSVEGIECPDCGYEIDPGAPVLAESGVEVSFGQSRCTECGCPWPLVPPPMLAESSVAGVGVSQS